MFAKKSINDSSKLILTCLITGFYPKDVKISVRKFNTSFPDHLITSSGIRPNHNGTYQLRKSVEIQEDEKAQYYCYVNHSSLTEPVIKQWDKHSLLYLYTIQSLHYSDSNIYDCTAVTLLDDRQIDFYNSTDESRSPKQNWLKNISQSDWKTSTEKLRDDRQLINKLLYKQMNESGHSQSGVHVLQWRHGCEGEQSSDGSLTVLNSINEFGYDGEDLIQFNCNSKTWITPENKKNREREKKKNREREEKKNREREEKKNREREEKWSKIFNAVKKCEQCEEILKIYLQYNTTDITQSHTPPAVHIFAKKSVNNPSKLNLTCLITGFYPKDVKMSLRKFNTEIPDHLITSSGVRPNDDGTYQLRKSVEIQEDDSADYNCYVNHSSLTESVIKQWVGRCTDCPDNAYQSFIIGAVVLGVLAAVYFLILGVLMMIIKLGKCGDCTDNVYLGLIIGVLVSGVLAVLFFLILCVLMIILKIGSCTDCPKNSSLVLIVGVVVSGLVALLCPVIFYALIRRMKLDNKEPLPQQKDEEVSNASANPSEDPAPNKQPSNG